MHLQLDSIVNALGPSVGAFVQECRSSHSPETNVNPSTRRPTHYIPCHGSQVSQRGFYMNDKPFYDWWYCDCRLRCLARTLHLRVEPYQRV